ncbi:PucR family transcriptional regulator [Serinibacter arcticus]|uniref:PucR family transcriptional regulator n=1 Tax=Serinibacter arcticus TaxID=1655435 RepID=UPI001F3CEDDB|nr:PucR family transcriptional regulator [Serinibacter arcticus]
MGVRRSADAETIRRLRGRTDVLTAAALRRLDSDVAWYRALPADDRSWIGLVATSGITTFIDWYENPAPTTYNAAEIFRAAPPELIRSISLQHALALVRIVVEIVEEHTDEIASPARASQLREAVLVYSREVAFSAAEVYARAAEARGAWDARMEALAVDSLLRGDDDGLRSRVAALGWSGTGAVLTMVGTVEGPIDEGMAADLRRAARRTAADALVGIHGDRIIVVLGGQGDLRRSAEALLPRFSAGPVVLGPEVADVTRAGRSARIALAGLTAARGWPDAPRPALAADLLPERALAGDAEALTALREVHDLLDAAPGPLVETLAAYLESGRSLEAAARTLFVHPNTVRYRLRRIAQVSGWDAMDAREGFVLQIALVLGRLGAGSSGAS